MWTAQERQGGDTREAYPERNTAISSGGNDIDGEDGYDDENDRVGLKPLMAASRLGLQPLMAASRFKIKPSKAASRSRLNPWIAVSRLGLNLLPAASRFDIKLSKAVSGSMAVVMMMMMSSILLYVASESVGQSADALGPIARHCAKQNWGGGGLSRRC